jgi:hypothetical protein
MISRRAVLSAAANSTTVYDRYYIARGDRIVDVWPSCAGQALRTANDRNASPQPA